MSVEIHLHHNGRDLVVRLSDVLPLRSSHKHMRGWRSYDDRKRWWFPTWNITHIEETP